MRAMRGTKECQEVQYLLKRTAQVENGAQGGGVGKMQGEARGVGRDQRTL